MTAEIVVVGAGQAGLQVATSLREGGYSGAITLVGDEAGVPYSRPPLSKAFLKGDAADDTLWLRAPAFLERNAITLRAGDIVARIDRTARQVQLASGISLPYDTVVLAPGARNRMLAVPGAELAGVVSLRNTADAHRLRAALALGPRVVVVGGGFLGLEVASTAASAGCRVHVVEAGSRLMGRAVSVPVSDYFLARHRAQGVTVLLDEQVVALDGRAGHVTAAMLRSGEALPADLVLVAIGVLPNTELAEAAGLAVANGIIVDAAMRTADPAIFAVGDCAMHPNPHAHGARHIRIESVQNATDQARCAAANILGKPASYTAVPWFWSDQAGARLQIAGIGGDGLETVVEGDADAFSVDCFRDGQLLCVESINRPIDHARARKRLALLDFPARSAA